MHESGSPPLHPIPHTLPTFQALCHPVRIIHEAEEGGFWSEVPAIPGCGTQGETFAELLQNLYEAIEGCLSVDVGGSPALLLDLEAMLLRATEPPYNV